MGDKPSKKHQSWTAIEKLRVVRQAVKLSGTELSEFLRGEGLHQTQLDEWTELANAAALASLSASRVDSRASSPDAKRIQALKRELRRKDKALAEGTALLVLRKKLEAYYEAEEGDPDTGSAT